MSLSVSGSLSLGLCLGGSLSRGGTCPGGSLSSRVSVQGVSVWRVSAQGGLCGGFLSREGLCLGDLRDRAPPRFGNVRTLRILLECVLDRKKIYFLLN